MRAYTLLEIIVACALFVLVIVLTFGYLLPATRAAARYRERSHLQEVMMVAIRTIEEAAATTSPGGFSWSFSEPAAVAFNPLDRLQPGNAALLWTTDFKIFWWDESEKRLMETNWPPGPPSLSDAEKNLLRGKRLSSARLADVVRQAPRTRTLARGVTQFQVEHGGSDTTLIQPVVLTLEVESRERRDDVQTTKQSFSFRLVNQQ